MIIPSIEKIFSDFIVNARANSEPIIASGIEKKTTNGYRNELYNATIIK
jgi:hypothetical protein